MELKGSFTVCTRACICFCHETDETNQQNPIQCFYNPLQYQSPIYNLVFQVASFPQVSPSKPCMHLSPIIATCPTQLTTLPALAQIPLGGECKSCSTSLRGFLQSPVTPSLLSPHIFLSTLFNNTFSVFLPLM